MPESEEWNEALWTTEISALPLHTVLGMHLARAKALIEHAREDVITSPAIQKGLDELHYAFATRRMEITMRRFPSW